MKVKEKQVLKNGVIAGYVYYKDENKWKWRIIGRNKMKGGNVTKNDLDNKIKSSTLYGKSKTMVYYLDNTNNARIGYVVSVTNHGAQLEEVDGIVEFNRIFNTKVEVEQAEAEAEAGAEVGAANRAAANRAARVAARVAEANRVAWVEEPNVARVAYTTMQNISNNNDL